MTTLFDQANECWFEKGHTARALDLYQQALHDSGNNPVIAYQLAFALLAIGRTEDAKRVSEIVERQQHRLGELGRMKFDMLVQRLSNSDASDSTSEAIGIPLDIESLLNIGAPNVDWYEVVLDAEDRGMFGVALCAYRQLDRDFVDPELLRDEESARLNAESEIDFLRTMCDELQD